MLPVETARLRPFTLSKTGFDERVPNQQYNEFA
jgi:hypothetical protein